MNTYDEQFLNVFNSYYPFERYIIKDPKPIGNLFEDALLTEIFIPLTEIKPILGSNGRIITFTTFNKDDIYIKLKVKDYEFRIGYFDFEDRIRENIRHILKIDLGLYEWECLYVDYEDRNDLENELKIQKELILKKYGVCNNKLKNEND